MELITCRAGLAESTRAGRKVDVMTTSPTVSISSQPSRQQLPIGTARRAWWPQSRDPQVEAADLVDHLPDRIGRVERLLFSRPDWDAVSGAPSMRRIHAARGAVKVGYFPSDDTHVMIVKMHSGQRLRLLVVPSDTEPGLASRVMQPVADDRHTESPSTLLELSGPDQSNIGDDGWDEDARGPATGWRS